MSIIPGFPGKARFPKLAALALLAAGLVLVVPIPEAFDRSLFWGIIQNAAHFPLFMFLAILCLWHGDVHNLRTLLVYCLGISCVGIFGEFAQLLTNRSTSLSDILNNILGVVCGATLWIFVFRHKLSLPGILLAGVLFAFIATLISGLFPIYTNISKWTDKSSKFPILFDATFRDFHNMTESLGELDEVEIKVRDHKTHVELIAEKKPGIVVWKFLPDWRNYRSVVIDIENPTTEQLTLKIHIRDKESGFRDPELFSSIEDLPVNSRKRLKYDISEIKTAPVDRDFDLAKMSVIAMYRIRGKSTKFIVHSVLLEK